MAKQDRSTRPLRQAARKWWRARRSAWRVAMAKWRVRLTRPSHPAEAALATGPETEVEPRSAPILLIGAALLAVTVLTIAFFYINNNRPTEVLVVAAEASETLTPSPSPTITPSSTPTITPTPTFTPTPTPATIFLTPFPTPDPLIGGGSIVFEMNIDGNRDLYALSIGQDAPLRLTNNPAEDRHPAWRPDGREIAFASKRSGQWDLFTLDLPTGEIFQITDNLAFDGSPSWSPDGQWLVYESYQDDNLDIYVVKRDGSQRPIRLTENPAPDFSPIWSPDGRHIAFISLRNGNRDLYLLSLDELNDEAAINLTNSPDLAEDAAVFHPRSDFIAYQAQGGGLDTVQALPLNEALRPAGEPLTLGQGLSPAWAPNGETLAYVSEQAERSYLIASSLDAWAISPQTYSTLGDIASPSWSGVTFAPEPAGFLVDLAASDPTILFTETITQTDGLLPLIELIPADPESESQPIQPFLSDAVDQSFIALRDRILAEAGWDLFEHLSYVFEPLDATATLGETAESWHKAGRAFDINFDDALTFAPELEIVPEVSEAGIYWRVYIRAERQDGTQGEPLRARPWDFRARFGEDPQYYDQGGRLKDDIPAGYYVDLTALAADYGWERIPSGDNWRTFFEVVHFWQFEKRDGLSWEAAMAELYPAEELELRFGE